MRIADLTPNVIKDTIEDFYDRCSDVYTRLAQILANENAAILRRPRRVGNAEFPFFFAGILDEMVRYGLGGLQASPAYIEKGCTQIEQALSARAGGDVPFDISDLYDKPLGFVVRLARLRTRLRAGEDGYKLDEVLCLSTASQADLKKTLKELGAKSPYTAEQVKKALEQLGDRV